MPASVIPITARRRGAYVLLEAALNARAPQPIGVLLLDPESNRLWVRLRESFDDLAEPEDAEVLDALETDIRARAAEMGAEAYVTSLEDSLSNAVRVTERHAVPVDSFTRVLDRLYSEHVQPLEVKPYVSHVPLFTLRAAAGKLGEEMQSTEEDWVRAPEGMRLDENVFAAHVAGRSMEPRIPDGSLNLFRFHPVGSRQGKIVLIERFGAFDETARYAVKRYTSQKIQTGEEEWRHERIRLEPLNPEFEAWDAEPQDFAVVAEWLRVLE